MKIVRFNSSPFLTCGNCGHERRRRPVSLYRFEIGQGDKWDGGIILCRRCLRELKRQLREIET